MIRCIAIDDEPVALSIISNYCSRRGGVELETFSSPRDGMRRILEWSPDVVFLDVEMNGVSGIELARQLNPDCCLIFTTAYAHYALDGFEMNAVDFLHKPYFYDRFERAMQKAEECLRARDLLRTSDSSSRQLLLKSGYRNVPVPFDVIVFVESIDNYVKFHLSDGTSLQSKTTLTSISGMLPAGEFLRIHRSFIVRTARIASFSRSELTLSPYGKTLPVGKKYASDVMSCLK
ncbi:MAG: LytR/AlgR family response regulator transcription factor [Candidatus Cryptobacteroides sp.]